RYNPSGSGTGGNFTGQFRDILIHGTIGYFALDDSTSYGGVDVVNLANPATPGKILNFGANQNGFSRNHDLFIDGNFLYIASNQVSTCKVFNITNPAAPIFVRNIVTTGLSSDNLHDMTIKNGRMYTSNIDNGYTQIYDVSNIGTSAPTLLGT